MVAMLAYKWFSPFGFIESGAKLEEAAIWLPLEADTWTWFGVTPFGGATGTVWGTFSKDIV